MSQSLPLLEEFDILDCLKLCDQLVNLIACKTPDQCVFQVVICMSYDIAKVDDASVVCDHI